ncbi:MAG: DUF2225 domain-containing protein [Bacillota bacterium]
MVEALYDKEIKCPVCNNYFHTKKVRTSALRIDKRDTDFCVYYSSENPIFYGVYVCPMCGYSALESAFHELTAAGKKLIMSSISSKWVQRSYGEKRSAQDAIEAYKLALVNAQVLSMQKGVIGMICLRLAWLHRYIQDEREETFLRFAAENIEHAFLHENASLGNMDEVSVLYLLGELNRKLGNYEVSIDYFNKAVGNREIKRKKQLESLAREQWRIAKDEYKAAKQKLEQGIKGFEGEQESAQVG